MSKDKDKKGWKKSKIHNIFESDLKKDGARCTCICFLAEHLLVEYIRIYDIPDRILINTCCWGALCLTYEFNQEELPKARWSTLRDRRLKLYLDDTL